MPETIEAASRVFSLDTNVLILAPDAIFDFKEHDVLLTDTVLEELDTLKGRASDAGRRAIAVSAFLKKLCVVAKENGINVHDGIPLNLHERGAACGGRLYFENGVAHEIMGGLKTEVKDNHIIAATLALAKDTRFSGKRITLVSNDTNVYVKSGRSGVDCEDYFGAMVDDSFDLISSKHVFPVSFWEDYGELLDPPTWGDGRQKYLLHDELKVRVNELLIIEQVEKSPLTAIVRSVGDGVTIFETLIDYTNRQKVRGVNAKSIEQNFALNLLLDPTIPGIAITGKPGSGKTLLSIAAALEMHSDRGTYEDILATRDPHAMGQEIGFLPGDVDEKLGHWMGGILGNIDMLARINSGGQASKRAELRNTYKQLVTLVPVSVLQGSSFSDSCVIVDEAQNLEPLQVKALGTRISEGSKVIFLGDANQIFNHRVSAQTSGLTVLIDRLRGNKLFAHIDLSTVERSDFAALVNERM